MSMSMSMSMYVAQKPKWNLEAAAPEAPGSQAAGRGGEKRGAGGGGGGCQKPKRADVMRQRLVQHVPGQAEALALANEQFYSPSRRMAACQQQRSTQTHHETLPLSPVEARPCVTPDCHCSMSHSQLYLSVPLYSPSQVRRTPLPFPACLPPPLRTHAAAPPSGRRRRRRRPHATSRAP